MEPMITVDLAGEAFAKRLANLLVATRSQKGISVRALVRASEHTFTRDQLKSLEAGTTPLDENLVERVSELYGCDLGLILPSRLPVVVGAGMIGAGGVVTTFVPGNSTSLLEAYLKLVRALRRQSKAPAVVLRRDDVDVLSGYLQESGETVVERLAALMGASRTQRTAMAGLFASGAVVIGLVGTAMAAGGGVTSRNALVHGPFHDAIGLVVFESPSGTGAASGAGETGVEQARRVRPVGTNVVASDADHPERAPDPAPNPAPEPAPARVGRSSDPSTAADQEAPDVAQNESPAAIPAAPDGEEWPSRDLVDDTTVGSDVGAGDDDVLSRQANLPPAVPAVDAGQRADDQRADDQAGQPQGDPNGQQQADEEAAQKKADEDTKRGEDSRNENKNKDD